jgi:hypothetical protein
MLPFLLLEIRPVHRLFMLLRGHIRPVALFFHLVALLVRLIGFLLLCARLGRLLALLLLLACCCAAIMAACIRSGP